MRELLLRLGLISEENLEIEFELGSHKIFRDKKTGVIFRESGPTVDYAHIQNTDYWSADNLIDARRMTLLDDRRRFEQFGQYIKGKKILDFGCGNGGFLDIAKPYTYHAYGLEVQSDVRAMLRQHGMDVVADLNELPDSDFESVFMFHVLEHLSNPIEVLSAIKSKMAPGGKIIVEVPHAEDFLLSYLDVPGFREHTHTSEIHMVLHTPTSLAKFLEEAGFANIRVEGVQRYSLNNHMYWLQTGKPGGMRVWDFLLSDALKQEYADKMKRLGMTDTIVAVGEA